MQPSRAPQHNNVIMPQIYTYLRYNPAQRALIYRKLSHFVKSGIIPFIMAYLRSDGHRAMQHDARTETPILPFTLLTSAQLKTLDVLALQVRKTFTGASKGIIANSNGHSCFWGA